RPPRAPTGARGTRRREATCAPRTRPRATGGRARGARADRAGLAPVVQLRELRVARVEPQLLRRVVGAGREIQHADRTVDDLVAVRHAGGDLQDEALIGALPHPVFGDLVAGRRAVTPIEQP